MNKSKACICCGITYYRRARLGIAQWDKSRYCSRACRYKGQTIDPITRFWSKVDKTGDCWIWTACKHGFGYGFFSVKRSNGTWRHIGAHRFAYELANQCSVGDKEVCHKCDNPSCVRPDHLFVGTQADNMADMNRKGRRHQACFAGTRNPNARLDENDIRAIRNLYPGFTQQKIADMYSVTQAHISSILRGKKWAHTKAARET